FFSRDKFHWKRPTLYRSYIKFAIPVTFISIFGSVSWNLDKILIRSFDTSASVGFFSSSQTILGVLGFIGGAVSTITFPAFSKLISEGRMQDVKVMTWMAQKYISMLGLPLVVATIVAPTQIAVIIFGQDFAPAGAALRYLAVSTFAVMMTQAFVPQIIAMDKPGIMARLNGIVLVLNFVLLLLFIPTQLAGVPMLGLGFEGAAIVNVICASTILAATIIMAHRLTGTVPNPRILLHLAAGGLTAVALTLILSIWTVQQWFDLALFGFFAIGVFAIFLALFRELTKADIMYLLSIIKLTEFAGYLGNRIRPKQQK
ncbi:MAG: polysaccharide biosynthesis C-terminal domain-containing protein, partial [Methanomassiliicoccales archaeon]|nr:polysaccharide biosynthesis C-terminal domain-containing protein [Methanomassiliicoccales archaeon]